jgi:hypothetical protein
VTLDLTCSECEASFELEVQDLLDAPKTLDCPNCEAKAPVRKAEALASAVDDLMHAMKELAPKFGISLAVETDDLMPRAAASDDDEDSEADEDEKDDADDESDEDDSDAEESDDELEFDR